MSGSASQTSGQVVHLRLCLAIARAGCKDSLAWWDDESLSEAGLFSLKRLFPRTFRSAAFQLALQSARTKHDGVLKAAQIGNARHLLEASGEIAADELAATIDDLWSTLSPPILDRAELRCRLESVGGSLPALPPKLGAQLEGVVDMSGVLRGLAGPDVDKTMAAAYLLGDRGKLVLPFVRKQGRDERG